MAPQTRTYDLPGIGPRTYEFPTVFRGVELLSVQLVLPVPVVAPWLPSGYSPAPVLGRAMVMATAQHFSRPVGMAPYTEASLAVRVLAPGGGRGWHTLTMPVDSAENLQRGLVIFGYPKELATLSLAGPAGRAPCPGPRRRRRHGAAGRGLALTPAALTDLRRGTAGVRSGGR